MALGTLPTLSATVMNMPGFRASSLFGICARTRTARVVGSIRLSMVVTTPSNLRSGIDEAFATTVLPRVTPPSTVSGISNSSLITEVSSSVVITSPGRTSAPRLTLRRPSLPLNGARITLSENFACSARSRASAASYALDNSSRRAWATTLLSISCLARS